jgi:hypothetical protein
LVGVGEVVGIGEEGIRNGKKVEASSGPVCEVPWRNIRVVVWV